MKVSNLASGKYVVAVSGGVDSVVLLDLLSKQEGLDLIVAHFDHGIRPESSEDKDFVAILSQKYNLPFVFENGNLGANASEAKAREARYSFLQQVRKKYSAKAIITAHHYDDMIETAAFNLLRGTSRKGMISLKSSLTVMRPLLEYKKKDIVTYAEKYKLEWREDSTNSETVYTRNWIRHQVLPKLSTEQYKELAKAHAGISNIDEELTAAVKNQLASLSISSTILQRQKFVALPHVVATEIMAAWLRENDYTDFDKKRIAMLVVASKTLPAGKQIKVTKNITLYLTQKSIELKNNTSIKN